MDGALPSIRSIKRYAKENTRERNSRMNNGNLILFFLFFNWLPYELIIILFCADNSSLDMCNQAKLLIKVSPLTFKSPDIRKHLTSKITTHLVIMNMYLIIYIQLPNTKNE